MGFLNHILHGFINKNNIYNFDKEEFKQRIFDCDFNYEDIKEIQFLRLRHF